MLNRRLQESEVAAAPATMDRSVQGYLEQVRRCLDAVPAPERQSLMDLAQARVELELELLSVSTEDAAAAEQVLQRLGDPDFFARRLRAEQGVAEASAAPQSRLTACRVCLQQVSHEAQLCPHCGAPFPARRSFSTGYEFKSKQKLFGVPLVHVAFGRDSNGKMRVAKGIIAVGQFAIGGITIAQFGVGALFGLGQFVVAPLAIGQFAGGLIAVGQIGLGILGGLGQFATGAVAVGQVTIGNWWPWK